MFQSRHFKLATCSVISYHNLINRRFLRKLARCVTLESGECDKRATSCLELGVTAALARPSGLPPHHVRARVRAASVRIWRPEKYADSNLW